MHDTWMAHKWLTRCDSSHSRELLFTLSTAWSCASFVFSAYSARDTESSFDTQTQLPGKLSVEKPFKLCRNTLPERGD